MIYKTIYVDRTFEAGVVVGSLRAFLAHAAAGELIVSGDLSDKMEVEIRVFNPRILAYAEDKLAAYV
jgi:hypothetical protein